MKLSQRIVTKLPLASLWTPDGELRASRLEHLGPDDVRELLRRGRVQFVVADVGRPLDWVPRHHTFAFWKSDVQNRIVDADTNSFHLEDFPDHRCFVASVWQHDGDAAIVLLESHH